MLHKIPRKYLPTRLTRKEYAQQRRMLLKSRRLYRQGKYYTRKTNLTSYSHKKSPYVKQAQQIYGIDKIAPTPLLAKKTGCSVKALAKIVQKGKGAYYSSGSRPNQTPQSWGLARLASAITGNKAAKIDYPILQKGCTPYSKALHLAAAHYANP